MVNLSHYNKTGEFTFCHTELDYQVTFDVSDWAKLDLYALAFVKYIAGPDYLLNKKKRLELREYYLKKAAQRVFTRAIRNELIPDCLSGEEGFMWDESGNAGVKVVDSDTCTIEIDLDDIGISSVSGVFKNDDATEGQANG